jgi:acetylornithine deacetylase/succinyl-diaminopimelate desuccinylase-like protein
MTATRLGPARWRERTDQLWDSDVMPTLVDYIRIPNVSPAYAADWAEAGHMARAAELLRDWVSTRLPEGSRLELAQLPGRTPVLLAEVPGRGRGAGLAPALLYGHLDKQPEMTGWREGLGPWTPVIENDRLYGRGGADDGYSTFAAVTALRLLDESRTDRPPCVILIEASEESGSGDLPHYMTHFQDRIGSPSLVVALDSGCADYQRLWVTTSLRGLVQIDLTVSLLEVGIHSGASGAVPSTFRILRRLLDRIEDAETGELVLSELQAPIPAVRHQQIVALCEELGPKASRFPLLPGARPTSDDPARRVVASTWEPALSVTGLGGAPPVETAGNVLRPFTSARLSVRLPPTADSHAGAQALKATLESDPPYGARVEAYVGAAEDGWNAPEEPGWLTGALDEASRATFGRPSGREGTGGSIPFVGSLARQFPEAAFLVTGVLGPGANAHGPNEFLEISTAKRITECVARVLAAQAAHASGG